MKKIYLGPGLRVIYYKNLSVFFATFIIYFAVCLGLVLSFEEEIRQFGAAFLGMPVFFLLFSYFTCYMDEQTQINELRNTMYYSMNYIVSLRLFYTAVVLSLVNTSFLFLSGIREKAILSVGVVGVSSMLVFAIIAVYIYHVLCRGEAWCKYQHRDFVVAHVFADSQTLRGRFCQNSLTV